MRKRIRKPRHQKQDKETTVYNKLVFEYNRLNSY